MTGPERSPLEFTKEAFRKRLSANPKIIEVPEMGPPGSPLKIHVFPMTLREQDAIYQKYRDGSLDSLVETVILRAKDADGKRIFQRGQFAEFVHEVDPDLLSRIVSEMNEGEDELAEALGTEEGKD